jgi:hypothetical protein
MGLNATEREVRVLAIFRQILGTAELGPEDNFFDAGGSSLLAARLASRLRNAGVLNVSTAAIFDAPTARALATYGSVAGDAKLPATRSSAAERGARQRAAFTRLRQVSASSEEAG